MLLSQERLITAIYNGKSTQTGLSKEEKIDTQNNLKRGLYDLLFPIRSPEEEVNEEIYEEALSYKPSFEERLAKGDKKI